jgi:hypothetical protein
MTDLTRADLAVGDDTPFAPHIRQYLGRQVRVTLDPGLEATDDRARKDSTTRVRKAVTIEGQLIHATDDGEVTLRAEDGTCHYAWPGCDMTICFDQEDA